MKILHVVPTYLPATRYGGPIYSVHGLCKALAMRNHRVHVFTTNIDGSQYSDVPLDRPVAIDNVEVHYFAPALGRRLYRSPAMAERLKSSITSFDIVHLHSVFLWPTTMAARASVRSQVPYVLSPRGMLVNDLIKRKSRLPKLGWLMLFERRNIWDASAIHATSESEVDELRRLGIPTRHVAVIPNGVDPPTRADAENAHDRPYVLSLGRLNWKKGLDRLIRAMVYVDGVDLLIAGNDEENHQTQLEDIARSAGIADRIRFVGPVHGEKKWALLKGATLFALPSHSENFGNSVLEAMACSCAVVITPQVGLARHVQAAEAGLVVDGDPKTFARALSDLMSDPQRRLRMGENGRRIAEESYSWATIAQQMEEMYLQILKSRPREPA